MNTFVNNTLDNDLSSTPYFPNIGENANFFIIFPAFSQNSPPPFPLIFQGGHRPGKPGIPGNIREIQNTGNIRELSGKSW